MRFLPNRGNIKKQAYVSSRQQLSHGDAADFEVFDCQGNLVRWPVVLALTIIWLFRRAQRIGVHFGLVFDKVDNPVNWNSCGRIQPFLERQISLQGSIRDFDHQSYVLWAGMAVEILTSITADNHNIGFRLTVRCRNGLLIIYIPAGR